VRHRNIVCFSRHPYHGRRRAASERPIPLDSK
jgi:hypothetical protein